MNIKFIAQSGFIITLDSGEVILIDPWLNNPLNPMELKNLPKIDYVFCTHDHMDHGFATSIEIAKRDNAILITGYDMGKFATEQGVKNVESCNPGGFFKTGNIEVKLTQAIHSSDIGIPVGFLIKADDKLIYHMGDTGYFAGTKDLGEMYNIDILMIPIGSRYTMDPSEALQAVKNLKPKQVIPMHYNTFPKITQDGEAFKRVVELENESEVVLMEPKNKFKL